MAQQSISVHAAKTNLSRLIERALAGEEIVIARGKVPVARLVPIASPKVQRKFGAMRGKARITSAFFQPLSEEDLSAWER